MGSTMCKGGSLQDVLQLQSNQTTQTPRIRITYKIIQVTTMRYTR
jgi:hypothetical protein